MGYLSICVDMSARRCLVIGGGEVAERKLAALLELEACVTVVSPKVTRSIARLAREGAIRCSIRSYRKEDLLGQEWVFIATNDHALNRVVAKAARARNIRVNAADDPDNCDFILPAILRRGSLVVAVSTGGRSPAIARLVREELGERLTEDYGTMLECAAAVRCELRQRSECPTAGAWRCALDAEFRALVARGERVAATQYLLYRLEEEA